MGRQLLSHWDTHPALSIALAPLQLPQGPLLQYKAHLILHPALLEPVPPASRVVETRQGQELRAAATAVKA